MKWLLTLCTVFSAAPCGFSQQDLSARLRPAPAVVRSARLDAATGNLTTGHVAFLGPDVVYNNTCTGPAPFFAAMSAGDVFVDNGQIPGPTNDQLEGCEAALTVDGFSFSYCSDQASVDLVVSYFTLHASCTDISGAPGTSFVLSGLPGSSSGLACWNLTIDLSGTTAAFTLLADGDGIYDAVPALDTFGVAYECTNVTGTTGMMLAGNPVFLGQGCDFGVGTVYEVGDPTGSSPEGTGYGTTDAFGLVQVGAFAGCFFFGGWPGGPWSSFGGEIFSVDSGCDSPVGPPTCVCDGSSGPAPCGNPSAFAAGTGCLNSTGVGAHLEGEASTGVSILNEDLVLQVTQLPGGTSGIFLVGTSHGAGVQAFDGIYCLGGSTLRLNAGAADAGGTRVSNPPGPTSIIGEGNTGPDYFTPGTYFFQYWYRDVPHGACSSSANFSNVTTAILSAT